MILVIYMVKDFNNVFGINGEKNDLQKKIEISPTDCTKVQRQKNSRA